MENNDIKKALECCNTIGGCKVCPYSCNGKPTDNGECGEKMSLDALALINSQEQKIKDLTENLHASCTELTRVQEENERLRDCNITLEQKLMLLGCDEQYFFKPKVKGETANEN